MADLYSVVTTTLKSYGRKMYDQVFDDLPFYFWMRQKGRQKPLSGGLSIQEQLEIKENTTIDWRYPKETFPIDEQDPFFYASFDWRTIDGSIPLFFDDERKNRGEFQLSDLAEGLVRNAEKTMKKKIAAALFSDGTDPKKMDGLEAIIDTDNVYGGINRATAGNEWWQSNVKSTTEAYAITGGTDGGLRRLYNLCTQGGLDQPDFILTTMELWEKHNALLSSQQRFENPKLAEAGFRNLMFDNAAITWDPGVPAGTVYVLTTEYIKLRPDTMCAEKFITRPKIAMHNQWADVIPILWVGNMTCVNPRFEGKMTGKS